MNELDKILENYCTDNGIYYEIAVKTSDGSTLIKHTSHISADDLCGYTDQLDEQVLQLAIESENGMAELRAEAQAEAMIEDRILTAVEAG